MNWDEERLARAALTWVCEAAVPQLVAQVAEEGAAAVWESLRGSARESRWTLRAKDLVVDELVDRAERTGLRFVVPGDAEWPGQLQVLTHVSVGGMGGAPFGLWLRGPGELSTWTERAVALVGSRACSAYGERVATDLAIDLAAAGTGGWTIVSGGAYGIDGCAHRGALAAEGRTVAVLASGLDEPYPRGNQPLFDRLVREQLLVSEVPCGLHPTRAGFLARNRLIAALCLGTVVVEAAARSGALNTCGWAMECERHVMAVPGPVHSSLSVTPHRLVREGRASLVCDHRDVEALVGPLRPGAVHGVPAQERLLDAVDPSLMRVREVLPGRGGLTTGDVARRAGLSIPETLASLGQLQQMSLVRSDQTGRWRICTPSRFVGEAS